MMLIAVPLLLGQRACAAAAACLTGSLTGFPFSPMGNFGKSWETSGASAARDRLVTSDMTRPSVLPRAAGAGAGAFYRTLTKHWR